MFNVAARGSLVDLLHHKNIKNMADIKPYILWSENR